MTGWSRGREGVARLGRGQLGDGPDLARLELADRLLLLAMEEEQLADPLVLVAVGVPGVGLAVERAAQDPEVRQAADERIGRGLEHAGDERPVRVGSDRDRLVGLGVAGLDRRLLRGGRQVADEGVEEGVHPDPLGRAADQDRREDGVADAAMEARVELGVGDLLALEVLGHHVVVGLGGRLEQLVAAGRDLAGQLVRDRDLDFLAALERVRLAMDEVDVAAEPVGLADREVERRDLVAEPLAHGVEGGRRVGVLPVALVQEEAGRPAGRAAEADGRLQSGPDAGRGVDDEERTVGGREAGDDLGHEVRVARGVDERDPRRVVLERGNGEAQRLLALLLLGLVVEMGGSVVDPAEALDGAGPKEELLGERRLAGAGVAGQDDAAEVGGVDALHRHRRSDLTAARNDGRMPRNRAVIGPAGLGFRS